MPSFTNMPLPLLLFLFATSVSAKTDLTGCTTTDLSSPAGASQAWYVPGTGELCDPLDCGGGRAPPKKSVPGCPQYTGTETYSPSFLAGFGAATASSAPSVSSSVVADTTFVASSAHTESTESGLVVPTTTSGFDTTVTGISATVDPSNRPLICALQASSDPNCGITWSTTTLDGTTSTNTITSGADSTITSSAQISSGVLASGSQSKSMTISLVETVPNKTSTATSTRGASSASGSATGVSTGAAPSVTAIVGGLGLFVAAIGGLAVL